MNVDTPMQSQGAPSSAAVSGTLPHLNPCSELLQVTLLAAGFVIGPSGHSIRAICEKSGANIQVSPHARLIAPVACFQDQRTHGCCHSNAAAGSGLTGVCLQSCTRTGSGAPVAEGMPYRSFVVVGTAEQRENAQSIITQAVSLYQDLFTGKLGSPPLLLLTALL